MTVLLTIKPLFLLTAIALPIIAILPGCARLSEETGDAAQQQHPNLPVLEASTTDSPDDSTETRPMNDNTTDKINFSDAEWKLRLTPEQYDVLRQKGTERPFTNKFDEHFEPGIYSCAACGTELFESDTKFNSGCGWPAFYAAKADDKVELVEDRSLGTVRTEVLCSHCGSHLGHIFDDAPQTPTGQRYCINSVSLKFEPKK